MEISVCGGCSDVGSCVEGVIHIVPNPDCLKKASHF